MICAPCAQDFHNGSNSGGGGSTGLDNLKLDGSAFLDATFDGGTAYYFHER
jgi:hypothetical protein